MNMQQILQMIHRNQEQIDLLTSNNTQLVDYLMVAGAQDALASLQRPAAPIVRQQQMGWPPLVMGLPAPEMPKPKRGRPAGIPNKPKAEEEVRRDTLGRKIDPNNWTPERRAAQGERMRLQMEERYGKKKARRAVPVKPSNVANWKDKKTPAEIAEWKRKLSEVNRAARARKAAQGLDYTTGRPVQRGA
jgi:hypothetical protein